VTCLFPECLSRTPDFRHIKMGATKTRDRLGSAGTRSQVLAFGTIGSRVPAFDVIAFTDLISVLPLDSDAVYTVIVRVVPLCFISIQL